VLNDLNREEGGESRHRLNEDPVGNKKENEGQL
jgi:hypothetical protein